MGALDAEPAWIPGEEEEIARQAVIAQATAKFMEHIDLAVTGTTMEHDDEDELLLDRMTARLKRGEFQIDQFDRIHAGERARWMRETDGSATMSLDIMLDDTVFNDIHTVIPMSGGIFAGHFSRTDGLPIPCWFWPPSRVQPRLHPWPAWILTGLGRLFVADQSS